MKKWIPTKTKDLKKSPLNLSGSETVLVRISIAVNGHHDHSNRLKGKHFTEVEAYS